jgi:hypothetical protein
MNVQELRKLQQAYSEVYQNSDSEINENTQNYILEYLVTEGYAATEEAALVIMTNMSEEWTQSIIEQQTDPTKTAAEMASLRNTAFGSKKFQDAIYLSPSNPKGPNWDPKSVKTPGV